MRFDFFLRSTFMPNRSSKHIFLLHLNKIIYIKTTIVKRTLAPVHFIHCQKTQVLIYVFGSEFGKPTKNGNRLFKYFCKKYVSIRIFKSC